ncbi:non-homologous end-joining DNA ligase [Streptomyces sp. NPDC059740]|uniref:non-homologous end-joining DNA ligase n=1 Tax=Streptomyces sp. NPDC059740 TaxID=3346926 RepID=UPI00364CB8F9
MPITEIEGRRLSVSNLEKVLYPATGTTKAEVLHYYLTAADVLLPHLHDRPVSFLRFPDGPGGQRFFAKNVPAGTPAWVRTAEVPHRSREAARQVVLDGVAPLVWAANLVTELHTPQWRVDAPRVADRLVMDLDPGPPATVVECCRVALWVRERLAADGLEVTVKTSGSKGLHLLVPVERTSDTHTTAYARAIAVAAERALPELAVHRMTKALRPGKVFLDFSQNAAAKTTATPYTLRAQELPAISAPVTWREVERCTDPEQLVFLHDDLPGRLEEVGDPLAPLTDPACARALPEVDG